MFHREERRKHTFIDELYVNAENYANKKQQEKSKSTLTENGVGLNRAKTFSKETMLERKIYDDVEGGGGKDLLGTSASISLAVQIGLVCVVTISAFMPSHRL